MNMFVTLICALAVLTPPAGQLDPQAILTASLANPDIAELQPTVAILAATGDKELAPIFQAMCRDADRSRRQLGLAALVQLLGKAATDTLLERLHDDPSIEVRRQALGQLISLGTVGDQDLLAALDGDDERIRCLAASCLAERGNRQGAEAVLGELTGSTDPATASLARVGLLALGHDDQLDPLGQVLCNERSSELLRRLLLEQIQRGKVVAAAELVRRVVETGPRALQVRAAKTYASISDDAAPLLVQRIRQSKDLVYQTQLLSILADIDGAVEHLSALAAIEGPLAKLVRFELARLRDGPQAREAVLDAMRDGHPVIVDAILSRARDDVDQKGKQAEFYAPGLLAYIGSLEPRPRRLGAEHRLAARAAAVLADLGTPEAMEGLKRILTQRYNARVRVTLAGLMECKNAAVCDLVRPLLSSPYGGLATDAALVLGYFADPAATPSLRRMIRQQEGTNPGVRALACWYLLKIEGTSAAAARRTAEAIR